ncbi:peptidoglycan DD-metalloendopeptidase family protein [bacterium]|nr:peptidoglycan DD-metalloendopeptidase family protein [bacterium]
MRIRSKRKIKRKVLLVILILGFLLPQHVKIPVSGATARDYNPESFWYYPWGKSIVHHGVDVFAKEGTQVVSATPGLVLYTGTLKYGGQVVVVLGPKWRFHYYAHLHEIKTHFFSLVNSEKTIGTVGSTGNAAGKPPHLHYSIATPIPYLWRWDTAPVGWQKIFYLNPIDYF